MSTYAPLIVGVFRHESEAKQALEALRAAGFANDQIGFALREGGAVTNSLLNDLVKLGVPQDRAGYYEQEYEQGRAIISVRPDGRDQEVTNLLRQYGAYDYDNQSGNAQTTTGYTDTAAAQSGTYTDQAAYTNTAGTYTDQAAYTDTTRDRDYTEADRRAMPLREEVLDVDKQRVQTGEARLRKEVVEEQKNIDVPVTREEVVIERRDIPGGRPSDAPIGTDETIRVPVTEEQVNVNKQTVETGEVAIGKRAVQETQRVSDTVRREEARLEKDGDPRIRTNDDLTDR